MAPDAVRPGGRRGRPGRLVVGEVVRAKALALVLEHAEVIDASGRPVDLEALDEPAAGGSADDAIDVIPTTDE